MTSDPEHLPFDGLLQDGVHRRAVRVYFEDTDFSGVVYHASYLRCTGHSHAELAEDGAAFAVARMEISFKSPARIDDVLTVTTRIAETTRARMVFAQEIRREASLIAEASVTVVLLGAKGKPLRMPAELLDALA